MGRQDWFRNTDWNAEIEALFFAKLKRARDKAQPLRIQACILASSEPRVSLRLLEQYFAIGEHFDRAQAFVDQAQAHLTLGQTDLAIEAYESALSRETEYPNLRTQAYIKLAFLIAVTGRRDLYERAISVLDQHKSKPLFPVDRFKWHAVHAIVSEEKGEVRAAANYARAALADAAAEHSGFRYHPTVGLVGEKHAELQDRLRRLAGDTP